MLYPLTAEHLLKLRLAPPGDKLPAVIRENLPRSAPLANGSTDHFQNRLGRLLTKQPVPHDIAGMIIDDPYQVHPVHPLQFKREDIDLPKRIGHFPLKPPDL